MYSTQPEETKDKMFSFLLMNYLQSKVGHVPNKISFLSGKPNWSTYLLKLICDQSQKREYLKFKDSIKGFIDESRIENVYDFDPSGGINYLLDLNEEKKGKIEDIIKDTTT